MNLSQQINYKIREIDEINAQVVRAKQKDLPINERVVLIQNLAKARDELGQLQLQELQQMQKI